MTSFDWYLGRVVHFDRPDALTVDHGIVRAPTDLHPDRFVRQLRELPTSSASFLCQPIGRSAHLLPLSHPAISLEPCLGGSPSSPGRWDSSTRTG